MNPDRSSDETVTLSFGSLGSSDSAELVEVPRRLGHVTLIEPVGQGGMGVVWRGRDELLNRTVAVKLFRHTQFASDPVLRKEFLDGARAAAVIKHANVVSVYHADEFRQLIYIVMEYVDGCNLQEVLAERHGLPPAIAALMTAKVLDALTAIHAAQVIHRDLKPANVMFDREGELLVSDFGLSYHREAASAGEQVVRGTPPYMAPETFDGESSFQSDIYAVGVMYYELLTGQRPFQADSVARYRQEHREAPVPTEQLDRAVIADDVREIIIRAMNKRKIFRYKSAAHMLKAVTDAHQGLLNDQGLDRALRELVRSQGSLGMADGGSTTMLESPEGTYFDLLSQRADAKRKKKEDDSR